jgi:hypothetical protein
MRRKYRGKHNLAFFGLKIAGELAKKGVPVYITGSTANYLMRQTHYLRRKVNDIDLYVNGSMSRWGKIVKDVLMHRFRFRFLRFTGYEKLNFQRFRRVFGKDWAYVDVFFRPMVWNRFLKAKVRKRGGLWLLRVTPQQDLLWGTSQIKLSGGRLVGGFSVKSGRLLTAMKKDRQERIRCL